MPVWWDTYQMLGGIDFPGKQGLPTPRGRKQSHKRHEKRDDGELVWAPHRQPSCTPPCHATMPCQPASWAETGLSSCMVLSNDTPGGPESLWQIPWRNCKRLSTAKCLVPRHAWRMGPGLFYHLRLLKTLLCATYNPSCAGPVKLPVPVATQCSFLPNAHLKMPWN